MCRHILQEWEKFNTHTHTDLFAQLPCVQSDESLTCTAPDIPTAEADQSLAKLVWTSKHFISQQVISLVQPEISTLFIFSVYSMGMPASLTETVNASRLHTHEHTNERLIRLHYISDLFPEVCILAEMEIM